MNFENLTIELHFLIIIFCAKKLCIKNNFIDQKVKNTQFELNLTCVKNKYNI